MQNFEHAKRWYDSTAPVVSKCHTLSEDIRPIYKRYRKWERIMKVNSRCYALIKGDYMADGVQYWGLHAPGFSAPRSKFALETLAPIVFRPGSITIHNAQDGFATGWYRFLNENLPRGFGLEVDRTTGNHFIHHKGDAYYLPHNRPRKPRVYPGTSWDEWRATGGAEKKLVFKRTEDGWEFSGKKFTPTRTAYRVDKPAKAKLAPAILQLREWMRVTCPLVGPISYGDMRDMTKAYVPGWKNGLVPPAVIRKAIRSGAKDPEGQMFLMHAFVYDRTTGWGKPNTVDLDTFSAAFNDWINQVAGFTTKTRVPYQR
jgi:hypothetical protein